MASYSMDEHALDPLLAQDCNNSTSDSKTSPRKEQKLSLSEYQTEQHSLSQSGEDIRVSMKQEQKTPSVSRVVVSNAAINDNPKTSTPSRHIDVNAVENEIGGTELSPVRERGTGSVVSSAGSVDSTASTDTTVRRRKHVTFIDPLDVRVPVLGFEVMEQRSKFTVFQLHVHKGTTDNWFIFRRFTDFVQLQHKLKRIFPMFRLSLPPKRWFRDNYDTTFLDDRQYGLQAFIDSILCHSDLCNCSPVQEFFCFNSPPGPHDSVEESRAYCGELEDAVYNLRKQIHDKDQEVELLRDELALYKSQVEMVSKALREANTNTSGAISVTTNANTNALQSSGSSNSLAECDFMVPEAGEPNLMLQKKPTNPHPGKLHSSQSEVSIHQEIMEVTGGRENAKSPILNGKGKTGKTIQLAT